MSVERVSISDKHSGATADILVGYGFNCYRFTPLVDGQPVEVIWSEAGFEAGDKPSTRSGIPILCPYPGRIQGARMVWKNNEYRLPESDGLGNAIHGFAHNLPWRIMERSPRRVVGQFRAAADLPNNKELWPADFQVTATYELEGAVLSGMFVVENLGDKALPCGLGVHPYFRLPLGPAGSADDCIVKVPVRERWELVDMIPTGKKEPLPDAEQFENGLRFGDTNFDDVFAGHTFEDKRCVSRIHDPANGRTLQVTFTEVFRECVIYNPPHREAICIEPYTCVPDMIRLQAQEVDAGLRILPAGEAFRGEIRISVE
jgi:aldose 1-epimerase